MSEDISADFRFLCRLCLPRKGLSRALRFDRFRPLGPFRVTKEERRAQLAAREEARKLAQNRRPVDGLLEARKSLDNEALASAVRLLQIFVDGSVLSDTERAVFQCWLIEGGTVREVESLVGVRKTNVLPIALRACHKLRMSLSHAESIHSPKLQWLIGRMEYDGHHEDKLPARSARKPTPY